jgi:hypothetical protein
METKEVGRIEYNGFLFPHSYSDEGVGTTHLDLHLSTRAGKEETDTVLKKLLILIKY